MGISYRLDSLDPIANAIMESLSTLASLRPRASGSKDLGLVPTPEVLRKLHRSLALEPNKGWYGNLPATRSTALHDDSTIKVKSPPAVPAATPVAPTPVPATQPGTAAYPSYGYNFPPTAQQQNYRPNSAYPAYKGPQGSNNYYQGYTTPQQPYYSQQSYTSNQQPYGATTAQQPYSAYQSWYSQYQPNNGTSKAATPTPVATTTTYGSYYNANTTVNGNGARTPAVANTVATKPGGPAGQAQGSWPVAGQQAQAVAPTLPSHLRTSQTTATTAYSAAGGYYQAYQPQTATPSAR
jgi:hypothetical protein